MGVPCPWTCAIVRYAWVPGELKTPYVRPAEYMGPSEVRQVYQAGTTLRCTINREVFNERERDRVLQETAEAAGEAAAETWAARTIAIVWDTPRPSASLLLEHMRLVAVMGRGSSRALAAFRRRAEDRTARVTAVRATPPRSNERWRVLSRCPRFWHVSYVNAHAGVGQWDHPMSGSCAPPLVAVDDMVTVNQMWPPLGSAWELAVTADGSVCYRNSESGESQWHPPPGAQRVQADPGVSALAVVTQGRHTPEMLQQRCSWAAAPPPMHQRVSMLASPVIEGEREPRWYMYGQWDAVARKHMFVNRLTKARRAGPWMSMPTLAGRIYYLNLRTSESRCGTLRLCGKLGGRGGNRSSLGKKRALAFQRLSRGDARCVVGHASVLM